MAGDAAIANPPSPLVSVIELSPMSGLASSFVKPGKKSASGTSAGPVNHSSPVPASWMPKSVPFLVIATTMLLPSSPRAGSRVALHAGMDRLRKKWSFPLMKSRTRAAVSLSLQDWTIAGASTR